MEEMAGYIAVRSPLVDPDGKSSGFRSGFSEAFSGNLLGKAKLIVSFGRKLAFGVFKRCFFVGDERHFFVGLGPDAYADVLHSVGSAHNLRRFVGASSTVGGWF